MSATMARQGGHVRLEQSDMRLALYMAKMAKGGCSGPTREETQNVIKKPHAKVQQETLRGVELPGHKKEKAGIE
jgi:hypothetical protein